MAIRWARRTSVFSRPVDPRSGSRKLRAFRPGSDTGQPLEPRALLAVDVLTYHNDLSRTGQNLQETELTTANVNTSTFGKVGLAAVDGQVYAQPLVKTGVAVPGMGTRDLVFVATEHDSVYAFDANTLEPIWHVSFIDPSKGITTVPQSDLLDESLNPEAGITSTPVIDPATNTMYVVSRIKITEGNSVRFEQHLHALDIATGAEKFGGPTRIEAQVRGTGVGSKKGTVSFDPLRQNNRAGLLLLNGVVYAGFASIGGIIPYNGWLLGFDASSLKMVSAFNTTPNGKGGGIWMAGDAPAADNAGNIYLSTGNGSFDGISNSTNHGMSVLKFSTKGKKLKLVDSFTPTNYKNLNHRDADLGSGGVLLVPSQSKKSPAVLVAAGKMQGIFVLKRNDLGGYTHGGNRIYQYLRPSIQGNFSSPAYFNGKVYIAAAAPIPGVRQPLRAFTVNAKNRLVGPATEGTYTYGWPGASPSISASGNANGVVWTLNRGSDRNGVLLAYDANDITRILYKSTDAGTRDVGSGYVKFSTPTIANGRVFVGGTSALTVYGLLAE